MAQNRALAVGSIAFVAANVLHTLDHLRQGIGGLTTEILAGGSLITAAALATLVLALRDDPRAPLAAAVVGLWTALGVAASHIAPHWSAFSDPYPDLRVDALSWAVMLAEIAAALALGMLGVRELRRQAAPSPWLSSST
jgi:hypothetical protein